MSDTPIDDKPVTQINAIMGLATKQPLIAVVALFMLGGTSGTLGSMYVAPLVNDALVQHEANDRAHDVDRIEERLDRIEKNLEDQGKTIDDLSKGIERAVRLLESK